MALAFRGPAGVPVTLNVNGRDVQVLIEPRRQLRQALQKLRT